MSKKMSVEQKQQWDKFNKQSGELLKSLLPILDDKSPPLICYSFLIYLADVCINEKNDKFFDKYLDKKYYKDCLDFFHSQLDDLYEFMKRNIDGQTNK